MIQNPTNPQTLNRYTYCANNPLKYTDPTGHDQIITTGGVDDNGDTWYTICDGQGNLLAIATGIDDLAQKMNDCYAVSRNVDLPLGKAAADFINSPKPAPPCGPVPDPTPVKVMPIPPAKQDSTAPYLDININIGLGWGITFGIMCNKDGGYSYIGLGFMSTPGIAITGSGDGITTGLNFAAQGGIGLGRQVGISDKMGGSSYTENGIVTPGYSVTGFWVWKLINPTRK